MYILDTDILSLLHAGDARLEKHKNQFDPAEVVTTIITRIEILRGRFDFILKAADGNALLRAIAWMAKSEALLNKIAMLSVNERAADEFERLRQNSKLKKIGRADLLIACIALANNATLVSRNLKHFKMVPGLKTSNWLN